MRAILAAALAVGLAGLATADDKKKADVSGTWKWETEFNGNKRTNTLKLKQDGDKITGAMVGRDNTETKIEDAKLKDGELTFSVTRERDGQKFTVKYTAKIDGDTIKGHGLVKLGEEERKMEFEGKREKKDN